MNWYCFIEETSLKDLELEYELEPRFVLTGKVSLVQADLPYSTCCARGQSSSAQDLFSKRDVESTVRVIGTVIASGAYGSIFCSDLMFYN